MCAAFKRLFTSSWSSPGKGTSAELFTRLSLYQWSNTSTAVSGACSEPVFSTLYDLIFFTAVEAGEESSFAMSTLVVSLGVILTATGRVGAADVSGCGPSGDSGAGVCVAALVADVATASLECWTLVAVAALLSSTTMVDSCTGGGGGSFRAALPLAPESTTKTNSALSNVPTIARMPKISFSSTFPLSAHPCDSSPSPCALSPSSQSLCNNIKGDSFPSPCALSPSPLSPSVS
mmetsp:Transcript_13356/g.22549  ORF Transcript_13356/g.22549 Transcript_13356/m.22549 type:complete len:234 (-) Transcript_13356:457-1158(-)